MPHGTALITTIALPLAHPERARLLVVATPDPYQAREVIRLARQANPKIDIVVRTQRSLASARSGRQRVADGLKQLRRQEGFPQELHLGHVHTVRGEVFS
jgi:hypothetical protein